MSLLLHELDTAIFNVRLSVAMGLAGYTAMIYDHILTFPDEVEYVWKAEKSPAICMFLLVRYITPIVLTIDIYDKGGISSYTSHAFCITWHFTEAVWYVCAFGIIHALVAMRVIAIWGRPRWIVILLGSLWLIYFATTSTIVFKAATSKSYTIHYEPLLKLCYLEVAPFLWTCWIPPLTLEAVLFALSCVQAFRAGEYARGTPIFYVLFRDGALHFMVIFVCSVFNMLVWAVAPPSLVALAK
ncbi:hypothetical protein RhiLY_11630 [Ceratobasidium sp. AG-Ba]|nr:hypothetical protein RhiLY_11630 [Ceratobasidium sp. AG-Ba]